MNRYLLLPFFLFSLASGLAHASQLSHSNYTQAQANAIIRNATNYINEVNDSGYLVFYPNLTQAYSYLNKSYALYPSSPSGAVYYATLASASAQGQYGRISYYRSASLITVLVLTVVVAALLYLFMRPVKLKKR